MYDVMEDYMKETHNKAIIEAEDELIEAVQNYSKAFLEASSKNDGVPTMNQIENIWSK